MAWALKNVTSIGSCKQIFHKRRIHKKNNKKSAKCKKKKNLTKKMYCSLLLRPWPARSPFIRNGNRTFWLHLLNCIFIVSRFYYALAHHKLQLTALEIMQSASSVHFLLSLSWDVDCWTQPVKSLVPKAFTEKKHGNCGALNCALGNGRDFVLFCLNTDIFWTYVADFEYGSHGKSLWWIVKKKKKLKKETRHQTVRNVTLSHLLPLTWDHE